MSDDATPDQGGTAGGTDGGTGRRRRGGTGPGGTGQPDPWATDLGRTVERIARDQKATRDVVEVLVVSVNKLAHAIKAAANASGDGLRPHTNWLELDDPVTALDGLAGLTTWVDQVYLAWPGTALPSCWLWHPWVVEELWALWACHVAAWHPDSGSVDKVSDFMERRRPGVVKRLSEVAGCRLSRHSEGKDLDQAPMRAPIAHATDRIATHWLTFGHQHQQPYPTQLELDEATTYEQRLNTS